MKRFTIITGICAVLVIATIFAAGCTSSSDAPAADAGTTQQVSQGTAQVPPQDSTPAPQLTGAPVSSSDLSGGSGRDHTGTTDMDTAAISDDAAVDPYNSSSQPVTMASDSEDLGDPIP